LSSNGSRLLANGLPLPKAAIIAELEGIRVAAAIAADVRGEARRHRSTVAGTASSRWAAQARP
jgi:hypothetical protein